MPFIANVEGYSAVSPRRLFASVRGRHPRASILTTDRYDGVRGGNLEPDDIS
jgi:hypothetical protein